LLVIALVYPFGKFTAAPDSTPAMMTYVFPLIAAPNFVSSMSQGDFVYFFFRETAVEYMNCGKVRKSAVADLVRADSRA